MLLLWCTTWAGQQLLSVLDRLTHITPLSTCHPSLRSFCGMQPGLPAAGRVEINSRVSLPSLDGLPILSGAVELYVLRTGRSLLIFLHPRLLRRLRASASPSSTLCRHLVPQT